MAEPAADRPDALAAWSQVPNVPLREGIWTARRMRRDMLGVVGERYERYGPVVRQAQGPLKMVQLFGPDAARHVLLDRAGIFSAKKSWDLIMGRIFTNGLLLRDGEDHRLHRRLLREAFRTPALEAYLVQMNEMLIGMLDGWDGELLAFPRIKEMTLEIACRIFLGTGEGQDVAKLNEAFEATVAASMSVLRLPLPGLEFNRGLEGRRFMIRQFEEWIPARRAGGGDDFFSRFCHAKGEDGRPLSDQEIIDHLIFLMMAAHDTTTSSLTSLLYELAANPEWQERVREEVRRFGKPMLDYDDMLDMPDTIAVIQETLRRYPPLSTIPRMSTEPFEWGGYEIPAGVMTVIYPIHTHHMDAWWTDPYRFDPERFMAGREEHARHSHSYIPFGGGNHMCLGLRFAEMQIKAVLFQWVQKYRWSVPDGYRMPVQQAPISKPMDGLPLRVERI